MFEFLRWFRVPKFFNVGIDDVNAHAVLHLTFTKVMQMWLPMAVLLQVFSDTLREQDVPGISAVHYALRQIDPDASHIRSVIHVHDAANWSAMYAHPLS